MHGVIFPQARAMKGAVDPVERELGRDQIKHDLQPVGQTRDRSMAVVIEGDEPLGSVDAQQIDARQHGEANAPVP